MLFENIHQKHKGYCEVGYLLIHSLMKKILLLFCCIQFFHGISFGQMFSSWGDQGNGMYVNPVLPADYSDLDVIRVKNDYYAISSTMQFSPGMVVLHSTDLVNWEIIGHVVNDLTKISAQLNWDKMNRYGRGIWAGSIRYYKNKFWVYFGTPDEGFFMSSATNPAGPWNRFISYGMFRAGMIVVHFVMMTDSFILLQPILQLIPKTIKHTIFIYLK